MFQIQDYDDLFLYVYCFIDDALTEIEKQVGYRFKTKCALRPAETLTIQVVGELMEKKTEKAIYMLLREYKYLFRAVISRSSFYKQLKKFAYLLESLMLWISEKLDDGDDVCFVDGFPIPIKKLARKDSGVNVDGRAQIGYCAAQDEYFYGLKGHLLIGSNGVVRELLLSPGNVHDVKMLPHLLEFEHDKRVVGDKGYISQKEKEAAAHNNNTILTEKRKNQIGYKEHNRKLQPLMKKRKIVETIISHLERLNSKIMKQRKFWTVKMRMFAKSLAINTSIAFNIQHQVQGLLRMTSLHPEFF